MKQNVPPWFLVALIVLAFVCLVVNIDDKSLIVFYGTLILGLIVACYKKLAFYLTTVTNQRLYHESRQRRIWDDLMRWLKIEGPLPLPNTWALYPDALQIYLTAILEKRPQCILECGSGFSTILGAQLLKNLGRHDIHIHALESDKNFADKTIHHLNRLGLSDYATVHMAELTPQTCQSRQVSWYQTNAIEHLKFDLILIDGPPSPSSNQRWPAPYLLKNMMQNSCLVLLDDAYRPGEQEALSQWKRDFSSISITMPDTEKGLAYILFS